MPWTKSNLPDSVKNKDWSDSQKETFVKAANAVLEKTGNEGEAIATGIKQAEEKTNEFPDIEEIARELGVLGKVDLCALKKGMDDEKEHKDVTGGEPIATAKIALRHLQEDPHYYDKLAKMEKTNSVSRKPEVFYCRHMQPGLCGYEKETILIDTDCLKKLIATGVGIPIYVRHQKVDYDTMKEKAVGYVTDSFYNEVDGWAWFKMLIVDDDGREAIAKGWAVSNAYIPTEWGMGGSKNNCPYTREIVNAELTHLAVVPDPRYEGACIMTAEEFKSYQVEKKNELKELQNSKSSVKEIKMAEETIEIKKGFFQEMFSELLNAVKKNSDEEAEGKEKEAKKLLEEAEKEEKVNEDTPIDVGGEKMPLKELINRYQKMNEKKNAEDEEAKKKEEEEKKNAEEEAKKKEAEEEKVNGLEFFNALSSAHLVQPKGDAIVIDTSFSQVQRGIERYGSK